MIILKSKKEIEGIKDASKILAETFEFINEIIQEGMETKALDREIEEFIKKKKALPAFKGYRGYPASSCISINEVVIHGIPCERCIKEGDLVSVDVGVKYKEFYSDAAFTFGIGKIDKKAEKLIEIGKMALYKAIEEIKEENRVGDISWAIQETAEKAGFNVVRDFVGHGVGVELHEDPPIPNFGEKGIGPKLKKGMTIAVEPMINAGTSKVRILEDGWTVVTEDGSPSVHFEHTILVTEKGPLILTESSLYDEKRKRTS
ncbi:MAG: type I methionyl aminopeptidase [candidate division WOR-3 bacterium]